MAITLKVTAAGRAALVNAANTGTLPVTLAEVGVTEQSFTAATDGSDTSLPGELKRLITFAGAAVAADTLHVTIRDDSADTYSLRGFALYLADGTLFALYGGAASLLEKSTQSTLLLAQDTIFADIDATQLTVGNTDFQLPPASTTVQGVIEIADDTEAKAGTDTSRAMTPAGHKIATDERFGSGAPSSFVKSLLTKATAAAVRLALGLKSAAQYDIGAGKGLDADKLDGQQGTWYIDWGNFKNVPATFAPSSHTHPWSQITSTPATATRWPAWGEVTGKPTTYPPAAHSHAMSEVNGLAAALSGLMSKTWTLTAGAGLTGGGTGSANRTVSLGTPSTITGSTTNSASGTTHTHDLSISPSDIGAATAAQGARADSALQPYHPAFVKRLFVVPTGNYGVVELRSALTEPRCQVTWDGVTYAVNKMDKESIYQYSMIKFNLSTDVFETHGGITANGDIRTNYWLYVSGEAHITGAVHGMSFSATGIVSASGFVSLASSRTVKHDIAPIRYGLAEAMRLPWVEYRYNREITRDERLRFGSAVEAGDGMEGLEDVVPLLVRRPKGRSPTLDYQELIPVIGRALQEYVERTDARIAGMQREMQELAARLANVERAA